MQGRELKKVLTEINRIFGNKNIVTVFQGNQPHTDGETITLFSLDNDAVVPDGMYEKMSGVQVHECGHIQETPIAAFGRLITTRTKEHPDHRMLARRAVGILEDIRMERVVCAKYPGCRRFLSRAYRVIIDDDYCGHITTEPARVIVGTLLLGTRENLGSINTTASEWIDAVVADYPELPSIVEATRAIPSSPERTWSTRMRKQVERLIEIATKSEQPPERGEQDDEPNPDEETYKGRGPQGEEIDDAPEQGDEPETEQGDTPEPETEQDEPVPQEGEGSVGIVPDGESEQEQMEHPLERAATTLAKIESQGLEPVPQHPEVPPLVVVDERGKLVAMPEQPSMSTSSTITFPPGHESILQAIEGLRETRGRMRTMRTALQSASYEKAPSRRGRLNPGKLPRAMMSRPDVFLRDHQATGMDTALTILVDMSGSMHYKLEASTAAVLSLLAGADGLVATSVLGFTTCRPQYTIRNTPKGQLELAEGTEIRIFKSFTTPLQRALPSLALLRSAAFSNNMDWGAIDYATAQLLAHRPSQRKILVVVSDGVPAGAIKAKYREAFFTGSTEEIAEWRARTNNMLKTAITEAEHSGIEVVGVGILQDVSSVYRRSVHCSSLVSIKTAFPREIMQILMG